MHHAILVGAGLYSIVLAERLASKGWTVDIYEKRPHIGGNCYDYVDKDTNIIVQKYGPHIIHIDDRLIYNYISQFTEFNQYKHHVKSFFNGHIYDFPINLSTINNFFNINCTPTQAKSFINKEIEKDYTVNATNLEEKIINLVGKKLYKAFFYGYTKKQWGDEPSCLNPSIINRIPLKYNYDTNYYKKFFNGIPSNGYASMFNKMLADKKITIHLNINFLDIKDNIFISENTPVIYSGSIDQFFDYKFGKLQYRNLIFNNNLIETEDFQGVSVINYPEEEYEYTRICEYKHFYPERNSTKNTIISKEIPTWEYDNDLYYPLLDDRNRSIYHKYMNEAHQLHNVFFGGRLGEYKYYDMEDTIKSSLNMYKFIIEHY